MQLLEWLAFGAPWWARIGIVALTAAIFGGLLGELVRRVFGLEQQPAWIVTLVVIGSFLGLRQLPQMIDPDGTIRTERAQSLSLSAVVAQLPEYLNIVLEREPELKTSFEDSIDSIARLNLSEDEKLQMATQAAFPILTRAAEKYRVAAKPSLLKQGVEATNRIARALRAADEKLCGNYVMSQVGMGSGYDLGLVIEVIGVGPLEDVALIDGRTIRDGIERFEAGLRYSPNLEFALQIDAERAGLAPESLSPDFEQMSESDVCDWFISYADFQLSLPVEKMRLYMQNDYSLGPLGNSIGPRDLYWRADYLGSGPDRSWFQISGSNRNRDDAISLTCTVIEGRSTAHDIYVMDTSPLSGADAIFQFIGGNSQYAIGEIERGMNLLYTVDADDPLFELVKTAFQGGRVLTVARGNMSSLVFDLSGSEDFFEAYMSRCEG